MKIRENVKKNIKYYLSLKKISQKEFSEKLSVSQSAVTNWVKGKNSPDIEMVAQICAILDISVLDLFGISERKIDPPVEQITGIFKKLKPEFQNCASEQIKKLLELQENAVKNEALAAEQAPPGRMVSVLKVARSTNHHGAKIIKLSRADVERLRNAPTLESDDDI